MRQLEELVMAASAGDKSAFRELLEREAQKVYLAALAVAGSPEEARDAVQEATLRAWQRLPELRDSAAWPAWFRQIAVRAAIDGRRRSRNGASFVSSTQGTWRNLTQRRRVTR